MNHEAKVTFESSAKRNVRTKIVFWIAHAALSGQLEEEYRCYPRDFRHVVEPRDAPRQRYQHPVKHERNPDVEGEDRFVIVGRRCPLRISACEKAAVGNHDRHGKGRPSGSRSHP